MSWKANLAAGAFCLLIGFGTLFVGVYTHVESNERMANATTVDATITESSIRERVVSGRNGGAGLDYETTIRFEYTYRGTEYTSSYYHPTSSTRTFGDRSDAEEFLADYPEGEQVEANVPEDHPDDAYLQPPEETDELLLFGAGFALFMSVVALLPLLRAVRMYRN